MAVKLRLVLSITIFFIAYYAAAQRAYWTNGDINNRVSQQQLAPLNIKDGKIFSLEQTLFSSALKGSRQIKQQLILDFPDATGNLQSFLVQEAPVLSPELSRKYPEIKSFVGYSVEDKKDRIRFSLSHNGIQSMIVQGNGKNTTYMQKVSGTSDTYIVYTRENNFGIPTDFVCNTRSQIESDKGPWALKLVDGQVLRKFRVAIAASGEYTQYHGGTINDALAAINATITRVNEIFESDLGVRLELVPNNDKIIYTNKNTDPYGINFNAEAQSNINSVIGAANYDIGHLFHQGQDGGNAGYIGSVCVDSKKSSAYSSATTPEGDRFDIEFVSHEMGHQFGANHTWSFESEGTLVQVEPGSGSTIMGYAGVSGNNNVTWAGDDYFHYSSIYQIQEYLKTVGCAQTVPLANRAPTIAPLNGYTIPKSTPFVLTGQAVDPDAGDFLTYTWEQVDNGIVNLLNFGPTNPSGANFRSRRPTSAPIRYFPNLERIVSGNITQTYPSVDSAWETVSDIARDLNFAFTVRDNKIGGAQIAADLLTIKVTDQAGPFSITSQNLDTQYTAGTRQKITWDVANTDLAPVNAQQVDIYFSTDDGATFPLMVAEGVPNNGSHEIMIPAQATPAARIMVKAHDHIFLAVNAGNITVAPSPIVLDLPQLQFEICQGNDINIPFTYRTDSGFTEVAQFSATGMPAGLEAAFTSLSASEDGKEVGLDFSNTGGIAPGTYPITITATATSFTKSIIIDLHILDADLEEVVLVSPVDGTTEAPIAPRLEWVQGPSGTTYSIEIAEDADFTQIIETGESVLNTYATTQTQGGHTYYWRVKPKNDCGEGTFGPPHRFRTIAVDCISETSSDTFPLTIPSRGTATITSQIFVAEDLPVADINVNLGITHSFLSDLDITLISPAGTRVTLVSNSCGDNKNILATFDDDGDNFNCTTSPAIQGIVKPVGSLRTFNGESSHGYWTLEVNDKLPSHGGSIDMFSLDICGEGIFREDTDKDGVFDEDDQCPNTPIGTLVDLKGCPKYLFPVNNFVVEIKSESCSDLNDGSILIVPQLPMDYQITVKGPGVQSTTRFTDRYLLENLPAGTYDLCITGRDAGQVYEPHGFSVVITQPRPLSARTQINTERNQILLTLDGASEYQIEFNGVLKTTTATEVTLDLEKGANHLKVYTGSACQGVFEEQFYWFDKPLASPNPFGNELHITLNEAEDAITTTLFNAGGIFIGTQHHTPRNKEFVMDFSGRPAGIYIIKLSGKRTNSTLQVIKK